MCVCSYLHPLYLFPGHWSNDYENTKGPRGRQVITTFTLQLMIFHYSYPQNSFFSFMKCLSPNLKSLILCCEVSWTLCSGDGFAFPWTSSLGVLPPSILRNPWFGQDWSGRAEELLGGALGCKGTSDKRILVCRMIFFFLPGNSDFSTESKHHLSFL